MNSAIKKMKIGFVGLITTFSLWLSGSLYTSYRSIDIMYGPSVFEPKPPPTSLNLFLSFLKRYVFILPLFCPLILILGLKYFSKKTKKNEGSNFISKTF